MDFCEGRLCLPILSSSKAVYSGRSEPFFSSLDGIVWVVSGGQTIARFLKLSFMVSISDETLEPR